MTFKLVAIALFRVDRYLVLLIEVLAIVQGIEKLHMHSFKISHTKEVPLPITILWERTNRYIILYTCKVLP